MICQPKQFSAGLAPSVIAEQLTGLGIAKGSTLLIHDSMRAFGPVVGGADGLLQAIREAIGESGTLMALSFFFGSMDPASWLRPPKPEELEKEREKVVPITKDAPIDPSLGIFPRVLFNSPGAASLSWFVLCSGWQTCPRTGERSGFESDLRPRWSAWKA